MLLHGMFFAFFLSLPVVNYLNFRLPALDQGIANQALCQFAHLKNPICTLLIGQADAPYFSLHLSCWVPLFAPFYFLFGPYTLFVFQAFFVVLAGINLQKIAKHLALPSQLSALLVLQFYCCWAWVGAFADGYHENVIAACLVPVLFRFFLTANKSALVLTWLGILLCKENMAIWLLFLIPVLLVASKQKKQLLKLSLLLMLASVVYFYIATVYMMPSLDTQHRFQQLNRYSHLGGNLKEIIAHVLNHPLQMIELFFKSHVQPDELENMKWELWIVLLFSGFWCMYANPIFSLAFLPLLAQKLWNKEVVFWGINHHYNVEFAPLLSLIAILYVVGRKTNFQKQLATWVLLGTTLWVSVFVLFERKSIWYNQVKENFLLPSHYQSSISQSDFSEISQQIPQEASVASNSSVVPHFWSHSQIYLFPNIQQSNYLLLLNSTQDTYPLLAEAYLKHKINFETKDSLGFELVTSNNSFTLFKRKTVK